MADILVGVQAYCKLLLHAAKYPHCAVNGVLLAEDNKSKDHKAVRFVDCIPLFHLSLGLAPMLEIALLQIDTYCRSKGYVIAGYYQANENYDDSHKSTAEEDTLRTATELLKSGAQRKLLDFDNHLDNVKNDWRNPELSDLISRCT
ncbi:hypothetical protein BaRGS_00027098 [Batillaria attramentaria]|uniref:MPN domain-containing protein n=1 Tax=Batillaria attramentaria TaxID=370345 RepID=A0ABD0K486_9CAEN